jgi:hypothetical protein
MKKPTPFPTGKRPFVKITQFPFYPFLIEIYAVAFLWSFNVGQVAFVDTLRALLVSLGVSLVVFLASLALVRNLHKAALISGWLLIALFLYGHFFSLVDGKSIGQFSLGRHRYFIPF